MVVHDVYMNQVTRTCISLISQTVDEIIILITDICLHLMSTDSVLVSFFYHIGGVIVSVLASSAVDRGFEPQTFKLVFVASPLSTQH